MIPQISVLLPLYNAEKYITSALESILQQTFQNFEVLIINDASTDQSVALIEKLVRDRNETRVRILHNEKNLGISETINHGIREAQGEYLARMDNDDLCDPTRFEKQLNFLALHPEIDLLGTGYTTFGKGIPRTQTHPETHSEIQMALLFNSAFAHPTVMMRKKSMVENQLFYDSTQNGAEDFELWTRAAHKIQLHNLQESLLNYRLHPSQMSTAGSAVQIERGKKVRERYLHSWGVELSPPALLVHHQISRDDFQNFNGTQAELMAAYLKELRTKFSEKNQSMIHALDWELKRRFTLAYYVYYTNDSLKRFVTQNQLLNPRSITLRKAAFFTLRAFAKKVLRS